MIRFANQLAAPAPLAAGQGAQIAGSALANTQAYYLFLLSASYTDRTASGLLTIKANNAIVFRRMVHGDYDLNLPGGLVLPAGQSILIELAAVPAVQCALSAAYSVGNAI